MKHILIDYENVQPECLLHISDTDEYKIWLFLGCHQQKNLPLTLVESLLHFKSENIHLIKMQHSGKNALDFYLSFYLGKISQMDEEAQICILARDQGYDVLVEHLNATHQGLDIIRLSDPLKVDKTWQLLDSLTPNCHSSVVENQPNGSSPNFLADYLRKEPAEVVSAQMISQCFRIVLTALMQPNAYLPSRRANLISGLKKHVLADQIEDLSEAQWQYLLEKVLERLVKYELIIIDNEKVAYQISKQQLLELIKKVVLIQKPKSADGLKKVINARLLLFNQSGTDTDIELIIRWLKREQVIKQQNQSIIYDIQITENSKLQKQKNQDYGLYQKAVALLNDTAADKRPNTKESLSNWLKSRLKQPEIKTANAIVVRLIECGVVIVPKQGKLQYRLS